jgi:eukaryotic-like serine/threonine-protein kinase
MASLGKTCASCGGQYGPEVLFCPLDGTPLGSGRTLANSPSEIDPYLDLELSGQIKLNALVGIGSMGRVYRAFQEGVDRDVAVKILHRELTGNQELVARFHREAKIASRLVHPNVVQVLMTGTIPKGPDARVGGEVYLVIEYLDGISLLSALAAQGEGGALPLARTLHIILQMCHAVGEAHLQGIIHRDLKPENIMLVRRAEDPDFVKVLDFGIARLDSTKEGHTTQAGLIFGTAKYISPEGAEGKHVGPQADVYAIATMLYQCLSGRAPFEGDSPVALLVQQINATPPDLHSHPRAAYVPEPIARLVMGNLAKDPAERSADARTFARELTLAARDAGLHLDSMQGGTPRGDLRLLSKQRTRQHEFSPELKAQIAAMPPSSQSGANGRSRPVTQFEDVHDSNGRVPPGPPPPSYPPFRSSHPDPTEVGAPSPSRSGSVPRSADARPSRTEIIDPDAKPMARVSRPGLTEVPDDVVAASVTQLPDDTINGSLEHENGRISVRDLREMGALEKPGPTIQGSPLDDDYIDVRSSAAARASAPRLSQPGVSQPGVSQPGTSQPGVSPSQPGVAPSSPPSSLPAMLQPEEGQRRGRMVALLVAVLVLVPVAAFAAVKLFANHGAEADPIAAQLEQAQEALEKRAWDAPPGANVKELTDRMLNESPGDRRVLGMRRAAADGILTDALALRDSGRPDEALRLARLALSFAPDLAPAQKLASEIERSDSPSVDTAAPVASASSSARPRPTGKPGLPGSGKPVPSAKGTVTGEPGLAPPTPPDPTPPTPGSSRPWL